MMIVIYFSPTHCSLHASFPLPIHPAGVSVQFNPTFYTVAEGGSVQLVVQKIGTADEAVTVTLSTQEGTADSMRIRVFVTN